MFWVRSVIKNIIKRNKPSLSQLNVAVVNTITKSKEGEWIYFALQLRGHHAGKSGQERKWRPRRALLTSFLSMVCSACFLIPPWTTCLRVAWSAVGWALPPNHQSFIKKAPHLHLPTDKSDGVLFILVVLLFLLFYWGSIFPNDSNLELLTTKHSLCLLKNSF